MTPSRVAWQNRTFRLSIVCRSNIEFGAKDADWQPVKDAARKIAFAASVTAAGYGPGPDHPAEDPKTPTSGWDPQRVFSMPPELHG
jgi:hypothetical protein